MTNEQGQELMDRLVLALRDAVRAKWISNATVQPIILRLNTTVDDFEAEEFEAAVLS